MAVKVDVAAAICVLAALSVFGAEGFFSVRQKGNGVWTFVDPDGKDFFLRAVDHVGGVDGERKNGPINVYQVKERMAAWGFNTIGVRANSRQPTMTGMPWLCQIKLGATLGDTPDPERGLTLNLHVPGTAMPNVFRKDFAPAAVRFVPFEPRRPEFSAVPAVDPADPPQDPVRQLAAEQGFILSEGQRDRFSASVRPDPHEKGLSVPAVPAVPDRRRTEDLSGFSVPLGQDVQPRDRAGGQNRGDRRPHPRQDCRLFLLPASREEQKKSERECERTPRLFLHPLSAVLHSARPPPFCLRTD